LSGGFGRSAEDFLHTSRSPSNAAAILSLPLEAFAVAPRPCAPAFALPLVFFFIEKPPTYAARMKCVAVLHSSPLSSFRAAEMSVAPRWPIVTSTRSIELPALISASKRAALIGMFARSSSAFLI